MKTQAKNLHASFMEELSVRNSAWLHCASPDSLPNLVTEDSRRCPICYALMKPPHLAPIILTPCGHTFCAKCIAVHTAVHRKKARQEGGVRGAPPCPHCRERIVAQSVNITLQNIITERLAIEENRRQAEVTSLYPKTPLRGELLYKELSTPRKPDLEKIGSTSSGTWSCESLQEALQETRDRQDRIELDISSAEEKINLLSTQEKELKQKLKEVSMEHLMVLSELDNIKSKKGMLQEAHADTLKKAQLIKASIVAITLGKECEMSGPLKPTTKRDFCSTQLRSHA